MNNIKNRLTFKDSKLIGNGERLTVTIELADDCKNGHTDFSITGDLFKNGKLQSCGCLHDEILKHFPKYKLFVQLHLSDQRGQPMYAIENGMYHAKNSSKNVVKEYLRLKDNETDILTNPFVCGNRFLFTYMIQVLGIDKRWKQEAKTAIKKLENLTDNKFFNVDEKHNFNKLTKSNFTKVGEILKESFA
jgi:hypothetical protein